MTAGFKNDRGEMIDFTNGTFDLLANCGAGLLAGWGPSWRVDRSIYLNPGSDNFTFTVKGARDCKLFGRLLRTYVRVMEERCDSYEKVYHCAVKDEDRSWGPYALLRRDELPFLISIAEFFERSKWVKRAH